MRTRTRLPGHRIHWRDLLGRQIWWDVGRGTSAGAASIATHTHSPGHRIHWRDLWGMFHVKHSQWVGATYPQGVYRATIVWVVSR